MASSSSAAHSPTIGNKRIWSLAYADDLVVLALNREALEEMLNTLKKFLKDRKLILSVEKTKILVFNKGHKTKKKIWKWQEKIIEEVDKFKYLGFNFNSGANYKDHIMELKKKAIVEVRLTWGLGENKCKGNFNRRLMLFDYLVKSVMSYGSEIWGWIEKKDLEKIQRDYLRWVLKLDFCTPGYLIHKETDRKKLSTGWGIRALRFDDKIARSEEDRIIKMCWKEKKDDVDCKNELYSKEKREFLNNLGLSEMALELERSDRKYVERIEQRLNDIGSQILWKKINESKYNVKYKNIAVIDRPKYLGDKRWNSRIDLIATVRCGNLETANKYWLKSEDKLCKLCKKAAGKLEHMLGNCEVAKNWTDSLIGNCEERCKIAVSEQGNGEMLKVLKLIDREIKNRERLQNLNK